MQNTGAQSAGKQHPSAHPHTREQGRRATRHAFIPMEPKLDVLHRIWRIGSSEMRRDGWDVMSGPSRLGKWVFRRGWPLVVRPHTGRCRRAIFSERRAAAHTHSHTFSSPRYILSFHTQHTQHNHIHCIPTMHSPLHTRKHRLTSVTASFNDGPTAHLRS